MKIILGQGLRGKFMVELSVAMPFYRTKYIGWLQFESLTRQQGIEFEWEICLIEEDNDETFGYEAISKYMPKLKELGCKRIFYDKINNWVPLARKVGMLVEKCQGRILTFGIADHYSPPLRLKSCYDEFKKGIDWYRIANKIFYDIETKTLAVKKLSPRGSCCKAVLLSIAKQIKIEPDRWKGVDGWFYRACCAVKNMVEYVDESDNWKYSLNTHGFNNITPERGYKIRNHAKTFLEYPIKLADIVPKDIALRLQESKDNLNKHKLTVPE